MAPAAQSVPIADKRRELTRNCQTQNTMLIATVRFAMGLEVRAGAARWAASNGVGCVCRASSNTCPGACSDGSFGSLPVRMIKRTMIPALLGLALASNAVLAQDMRSPAIPAPDRKVQPLPEEQVQAEQKRLKEYWTTHDYNAPAYPFNP